jgi:hypothetical protein
MQAESKTQEGELSELIQEVQQHKEEIVIPLDRLLESQSDCV